MKPRAPLNGADLPAPLAKCWRHIARHVAKTGRHPSERVLAEACGCVASTAGGMRRRLIQRGYLARERSSAHATRWRLLAWPAGFTPRDAEGRVQPSYTRPVEPSRDDIERMLRLKVEGCSVAVIADKTGFSCYRVEMILGMRVKASKPVPEAPPKRRQCLMCGAEFNSTWSGNRVCQDCKSTRQWRGGNDLSFDGPRAGRAM
jgi:hypothetical protein